MAGDSFRRVPSHVSEPEPRQDGDTAPGQSVLACPRCGLRVKPRMPILAIEYCPRCIVRARIAVRLVDAN